MEDILLGLLKDYGYPILFIWSCMEGEVGLIMAGLMSHAGHMNLWISIAVAGIGGFVGDQIWFYIGRYNKHYAMEVFKTHRRKVALAHLLLRKYGWYVIFIQRYLYGLRTIIPMAIGMTRYSRFTFAFINFVSAFVWAALTIIVTYIFGEPILHGLHYLKDHWYFVLPFVLLMLGGFYFYLHTFSKKNPNNNKRTVQ